MLVYFVRQVIWHPSDSLHYLASLQQTDIQQCYAAMLVFCKRHRLCRIPSISPTVHFITPDCRLLVTSLCTSSLLKTVFSAWGNLNYKPIFFLTAKKTPKTTLFLTVLSIHPLQLKCLPASGTFLLSQSLSSPRIFHLSDSNHVQPETLFLVGTVALFEIGTQSSNSSQLWRNLESNEDVTIEINGDKE